MYYCRIATVASGAASGKLLQYEVGGPRLSVQTAYGVEVEVGLWISKNSSNLYYYHLFCVKIMYFWELIRASVVLFPCAKYLSMGKMHHFV